MRICAWLLLPPIITLWKQQAEIGALRVGQLSEIAIEYWEGTIAKEYRD